MREDLQALMAHQVCKEKKANQALKALLDKLDPKEILGYLASLEDWETRVTKAVLEYPVLVREVQRVFQELRVKKDYQDLLEKLAQPESQVRVIPCHQGLNFILFFCIVFNLYCFFVR